MNTAIIKAIKLTEDKDFVEKNLEHFRKSMSEVFKAFEEFRKTMVQAVIPSFQALRNIVPPVLEQIRETYKAIDFSGFKKALFSWRDVFENQENELIECDNEDAETTNTETDSTKELNDSGNDGKNNT